MRATRGLLCWLLLGLNACAGGSPLLHPAHVLPEGRVSFAAGSSGRFALGDAAEAEDDLKAAQAEPGGAVSEAERGAFTRGALARLALAPGVAPFVAGRIGLGRQNEAGFGYTGRAVRLDFRHAFERGPYALSIGAAASGVLSHSGDAPVRDVSEGDGGLRSVELTSARGYGADLPVLVGYRSDGDVVMLWTGVRAGFESTHYRLSLVVAPDDAFRAGAEATRFWGGGVLGFAVGLPPVQIAIELNAAYESVTGSLETGAGELSGDVTGLSLVPAAAISAKF